MRKYNFVSRKFYICILAVLICLIGSLTLAYAVLNTTLNIVGNAEIVASTWDVYISSEISVDPGSVSLEEPVLSDDKMHVDFNAKLEEPGDYYRFVVRIKNRGSIDAMIDSIVKTPELTAEQAKYLTYNIEYEDGTSITEKHLLEKESGTVRVAVTIAFRTDIEISDLPSEEETLNLGFTVVYTQADENNIVPVFNTTRDITIYSYVYDSFQNRTKIIEDTITVLDSDTYETRDCTITGDDNYCALEDVFSGRKYKVSLTNHPGYVMRDATLRDSEGNYNSIFVGDNYIQIPDDYSIDDGYAKFYFDTATPSNNKTYRIGVYIRESDDSLVRVDDSSVTITNLITNDVCVDDLTIDEDNLYLYNVGDIISNVPYEITLNLGDVSYTIDSIKAKNGQDEYINVNYNGVANQFIIPSGIKDDSDYVNVRVYVTLN